MSEVIICFVCRGRGVVPYYDDQKRTIESTDCTLCKGSGKLKPKVFMKAVDWEAVEKGGNRD